jgi:hypothetical protein
MATPQKGDVVDVIWGEDGGHHVASIVEILGPAAKLHLAGPPEIMIYTAQSGLRETGPRQWALSL